jgi:hypothetical protein
MSVETELCLGNVIKFRGVPFGDLYVAAIVIRRQDVPSVSDVIAAASGNQVYKIARLSISIDRPPVRLHLAIDPHRTMTSIDREYLYPTDYMPRFKPSSFFKNAYDAVLDNFYYQIALNTLPGDAVFLEFNGGRPFSGEIRVL